MHKKILVTGGAGYIGSILVRQLVEQGHFVRVLDNLAFGGEAIVDLITRKNFDFVKGDIRSREVVERSLLGIDHVAHLAAIVGDPACAQNPKLARSTNLEGSKQLYDLSERAGCKTFTFASTCSNYGRSLDPNAYVDEESELRPVSLYAETKVEVEKYLLSARRTNRCKPICLRFSTVYGLSPRPRFDLTVNEFVKQLALGRELVVFGEQFWRPYCHVEDLARSVVETIRADPETVSFQVFNVGDTKENYQKKMIVEEIRKFIPDAKIKYVHRNEDPRDYRVDFRKINKQLGFSITKTVPDGIADLLKAVREGFFKNPDDASYQNVWDGPSIAQSSSMIHASSIRQ